MYFEILDMDDIESEYILAKSPKIKKVKGYYVEERNTDDHRKIQCYISNPKEADKDWYSEGTKNHRVENGHIKRDEPSEFYIIEVTDLTELLELRKLSDRDLVVTKKFSYIYNDELIPSVILNSWIE